MSDALHYPVYGGYGELITEYPATQPAPDPVPAPETDNGPHLSYAIQWVTFAFVAIVGWYVLIRKEAERIAEERAALAESSGASGPDPDPDHPEVEQDGDASATSTEGNA